MRQPGIHRIFDRLCKTMLVALFSLPGPLAASDLCGSAADRLFIFSEPAQAIPAGEQRCYTTELSSAGIWLVVASTEIANSSLPSLWISMEPCDQDEDTSGPFLQALRRTSGSALLRVLVPGRYLFCVLPRDPERELGVHRVSSLFAPNTASDPDEDEPDPRPIIYRP